MKNDQVIPNTSMSYTIETRSVSEFVTDVKIKLPRFQRKSTWSAKQNFELAISIFQEYPVGVVIINDEGHTSWLLDGRQRRSALKDLRANPDLVYEWARRYIKFKAAESDDNVKAMFWETVDSYLQKEDDDEDEITGVSTLNEEDENADINKWRQREGLKTLLEIILMVHQVRSGESKWTRLFDLQKFIDRPSYAPKRDGFKVNPVSLRTFLLDYKSVCGQPTIENFVQHMDDHGGIKDGQEKKFRDYLDIYWTDMKHIIDVVSKSEQIYTDARIGVILLKNVTPLDAQNIFSRINSGGTQLKAEELLSAKPFWNETVSGCDSKMLDLVKEMYERLGVETPQDGAVVRWDYGATLISRIKDKHLFFENYLENVNSKEIDMTQITLGFKLMSSYFRNGMSAIVVSELEKDKTIRWGRSIDDLVDDINTICDILLNNEFFKFFKSWHKSIFKLMGSAIVLEYITILLRDWHEKECPRNPVSGEFKNFVRDAKILLERLIFEYAIGAWKGSGDSKMASHIKNWKERIQPLDDTAWANFIDATVGGTYNGQPLDIKHLTPILCFQYALLKRMPENPLEETSEVDHVFPQAKLAGNPMVEKKYKDSLFNLILLPKADNIQKKDKALNEISDLFLRSSISKYTGIDPSDFEKYSDVTNIESFKELRIAELKKTFGEIRAKELAN